MGLLELREYLKTIPGIELLNDEDIEIIKNNIIKDIEKSTNN